MRALVTILFVFVLVFLRASVCFAASPGFDGRCAPETVAWIKRADEAIEGTIVSASCPPGHVRVTLRTEAGQTLDVEIASLPGPAFRSLQRLRVSPIAEITDWKSFSKPEHDQFELFYDWLVAHEAEVVLEAPPPLRQAKTPKTPQPPQSTAAFSTPILLWLALFFSLFRFGGRQTSRSPSNRYAFVCLFLSALVLRFVFGPFAPHHINGQGPLWILGAAEDASRLAGYGPGYAEIFSMLRPFGVAIDTAIFTANVFISALAAPLLFSLALGIGLDKRRALFAAAFFVVDPVSIRMSATEAYFPWIVTLTLAAANLFVEASHAALGRRPLRASALALAGVFFAVQAARIHPIAWAPALLSPLFVTPAALTTIAKKRAPTHFSIFVYAFALPFVLACLIAATTLATTNDILGRFTARVSEHWTATSGLLILTTSLEKNIVWVIVALAVTWSFARPKATLWPAFIAIAALVATQKTFGQSALWAESYARLWLAPPLLLVVALIPANVAKKRFAPAIGAIILGAVLVFGRETLQSRTTEQYEYRFFRDAFAQVPKNCQVAYTPRIDRRVVLLPEQTLGAQQQEKRGAINLETANDLQTLLKGGGCFYYAHTSICSTREGRNLCADIEHGLRLVPKAKTSLKASPSYDDLPYDADPIELGLYEIQSP